IMKKTGHEAAARRHAFKSVSRAFRVVAFLAGVDLTVINHEAIPTDEPVLYVGNHRSYFDIVLTWFLCADMTGYVAKPAVEKVPLLGSRMRDNRCLSIDRENNREALKTILKGIEYLKEDTSMFIFPEGTRATSPDGALLPFKEGSLKLAEKSGRKIIPVAITNCDAIYERQAPRLKPSHVIIEYLDPIDTTLLTKEEKKGLGAKIQASIQEACIKNQKDI
ncbi:MAG: 1-acyl-sn-glycerol-3-phosphate acyltransferase, partial [Eubacterium sp.]|nr:1-acyl-sn-glycerol-3-phosphate acyltransferase [Eubacterium sp.]